MTDDGYSPTTEAERNAKCPTCGYPDYWHRLVAEYGGETMKSAAKCATCGLPSAAIEKSAADFEAKINHDR